MTRSSFFRPSLAVLLLFSCTDAPATSTDGAYTSSTGGSGSTGAVTGTTAMTSPAPTTTDPGTGTTSDTAAGTTAEATLGTTGASTGGSTSGSVCGDGVVEPGEQCDDGPDNADAHSCTADCTLNVCGDGKLGPGEGCDDGNAIDRDACSNACVPTNCGNGVLDVGEQCDDGDADDTDACTSACTNAVCGDGFVQPGLQEQCDDGPNNDDKAACTAQCNKAVCGDGLVWEQGGVEQCDDGPNNGPSQLCHADCQLNVCGDGDPSPLEECDDGALNGPGGGCLDGCIANICGDGDKGPLEECDDGNNSSLDGCTNMCTLAVCGDGFKQPGEECDKGWNNNSNTGTCTFACKLPKCGDGFKQPDAGENCDDGNLLDGDACSNNCQTKLEILQVHVGDHHNCVIVTGGRVKCWGRNDHGELGLGDTATRGDQPGEMGGSLPYVDLGAGVQATDLALGASHTCALLSTGTVKCWGGNAYGQLGQGDTSDRGDQLGEMGDNLPLVALDVAKVVDISAGADHTCVETSDAKAKCWGRNTVGQLGLGDTNHRGDQPGEMGAALPYIDFGAGMTVIFIRSGSHHNCVWLNNSRPKCWGLGGVLGLGDLANRGDDPGEMSDALPLVELTHNIHALTAGADHTCVLLTTNDNKATRCWGRNDRGQLGLGDIQDRGDQPGEMGAALPVTESNGLLSALLAGAQFVCFNRIGGETVCWGRNDVGQLGLGHTEDIGDEPGEMGPPLGKTLFGDGKQSANLPSGLALGPGASHACTILNDGTVKCWGHNSHGELGLGDIEHRGDQPGEMGDALPTVKLITDWF